MQQCRHMVGLTCKRLLATRKGLIEAAICQMQSATGDESLDVIRRYRDRTLKVGQCLARTPELCQRVGTVVECVRQLRIDRRRLREGGHRLLVAPEQSQHVAAIEMGLGEAGIEGNRPFEACKGLLMAARASAGRPPAT